MAFLAAQPDLGTKMAPRFVRALAALPVTATNKVHRVALRQAGLRCPEPVWWTPLGARPAGATYRPFTDEDRAALLALYGEHDRTPHLLDR